MTRVDETEAVVINVCTVKTEKDLNESPKGCLTECSLFI